MAAYYRKEKPKTWYPFFGAIFLIEVKMRTYQYKHSAFLAAYLQHEETEGP